MDELDPVIHPLNRFKICATLHSFGAVEGETRKEMRFSALRSETGMTDATLSKQLSTLEFAGYVSRFREYGSSRAKDTVWVMLTALGDRAFTQHLSALKKLAGS